MSRKIAIVLERANIALGGAERSVFELASALSKLHHDVHIIAAKGQKQNANVHILCQDTPGKRVPHRTFAKAVTKHTRQSRYDIIHSVLPFDFVDVYQPRGGTYAESILRNAASYETAFVRSYKKFTAFANLRRSILLHAEKQLCKKRDGPRIVAISQYVAEQFKRHYGLGSDRVVVIPNGIRINRTVRTDKADRLRSQIFSRLNATEADRPVLFLFAAHNFRLKGCKTLLTAMHSAIHGGAERPPCAVIVGSGKTHRYRRLAKKLNIHNSVVFLGNLRRMQDTLSISDAGILPTFYDPCSRFILEVLAAGKPVITTKFNGATDLFQDGRHGKVIDSPDNTAALAQAVIHFTHTDNIISASQAIIDDNVRQEISIHRVAKQLTSLYEDILQKKGRE